MKNEVLVTGQRRRRTDVDDTWRVGGGADAEQMWETDGALVDGGSRYGENMEQGDRIGGRGTEASRECLKGKPGSPRTKLCVSSLLL